MDRKVVKYTNEDYIALENMILNNPQFEEFNDIYKTGFFEKEIVKDSNKHNFFRLNYLNILKRIMVINQDL